MQFVVDHRGRIETESIAVLQSSHKRFSEADRDALATWSGSPAYLKASAVRQIVVHAFDFRGLPCAVAHTNQQQRDPGCEYRADSASRAKSVRDTGAMSGWNRWT